MCPIGLRGHLAQLHCVSHLQLAPVPSPLPIIAISLVFSTIEASVWPLDSSAQLFDLPSSLPWLMKLHEVSVTSRVYPCNSHIGIPLGNLTTYPLADPDPQINTRTETWTCCVGMGISQVQVWVVLPIPTGYLCSCLTLLHTQHFKKVGFFTHSILTTMAISLSTVPHC